jgi:hypothetical protein
MSALVPVLVEAGGGAKPTISVNVRNAGTAFLAVIVDPPAQLPANLDEFRRIGGKTLNPGETVTFKVKEGPHVLGAAYIDGNTGIPGPQGGFNFAAIKGQLVRIRVAGNANAAPVITFD